MGDESGATLIAHLPLARLSSAPLLLFVNAAAARFPPDRGLVWVPAGCRLVDFGDAAVDAGRPETQRFTVSAAPITTPRATADGAEP